MIEFECVNVRFLNIQHGELTIEIFLLRDCNICSHGCKDNLIKDTRMVCQTKDTIILYGDSVDG